MQKINLNTKTLNRSILAFFIFGSLFLTIRLLLIGSATSQTIFEYLLSMAPELFVLFIAIYFSVFSIKNKIDFRLNYFDWMLLIYVASNVLIGTFLAHNIKISFYAIRMSYLPMIFYFLAAVNLSEKKEMGILLDRIFKWVAVLAIIGLVLYFGFYDTMIYMISKTSTEAKEYFIVRMTSIFWSPVVFGTFMTCSFLYFFYKSIRSDSLINYFFQIIICACVLLSVTRGAMIGLLVGLILLAFLSRNWKKFFLTMGLMTIVFIAVSYYIATPYIFANWILSSASETIGMKAGVTRVELWLKALDDFKEYPFGRGLGKAGHVAARFFGKNSTEASVASTDGWFLKLANETGLWGLFSYFIISLTLFVSSIKYIHKNGFDFFSFLFTIFVIINIQNLVSNVLDFYLFSNLYWLMIGVMMLYIKINFKELK